VIFVTHDDDLPRRIRVIVITKMQKNCNISECTSREKATETWRRNSCRIIENSTKTKL